MKFTQSKIKALLSIILVLGSNILPAETTRVSCVGNLEKTNIHDINILERKDLKNKLDVTFKNGKAIVPGAILSCKRKTREGTTLCEQRAITQLRLLRIEKRRIIYKYVDSVKKQTEIFVGLCHFKHHSRAQ